MDAIGDRVVIPPPYNKIGNCPDCGKPIGRLKATSQWVGTKAYPTQDSIIYHLSPWMTKTKIGCSNEPD
jgi:hypothetical protein